MEPDIYAVVVDGVVTNTVVWDGQTEWAPESGDAVEIPEGVPVSIGWFYKGDKFSAPPEPEKSKEQLIAEAAAEQQTRLDYASSRIVVWQTKLLMGRKLTDAESKQLNTWMDYIDAVSAIDPSAAPDIEWPTVPDQ